MGDQKVDGNERVVEEDGITVYKSFSTDEFPVPAVAFRLESSRSDAVRVRLIDTIPESFPMERVGFHPDFESENWTAYSDHRVEFERVIDPEETVRTVFGIRGDDIDIEPFLTEPEIEHVPEGESIEDVLGTDGTDPVREVVSGERDSLPGMDASTAADPDEPADTAERDDSAAAVADALETKSEPVAESISKPADETGTETDAESTPTPRTMESETTPAVTLHVGGDESMEDASDRVGDESKPAADESKPAADEIAQDDPADVASPTDGRAGASLASALAAEIRAGDVEEDDLELLREELDLGTPRSVDVRISRLQSRVEDLSAYADALEAFIDEEGTAESVLEEARTRAEEVSQALAEVETQLEDAADERRALTTTISDTEERIDGIESDVSASLTRITDAHERLDALEPVADRVEELESELDRLDDVESSVDTIDEEVGDVWSDIAELDTRVTDVEDVAESDVTALESEIERIDEELEELEAFRERLNDAFGT